ncbi:gamma-glutamyltransferase [Nostoc sp. FACHB-892]|uniref:gamma-glutamyltransferase n=1 Tax=Nostoc sp. FACHB-892 TaxID=2692843 RepID=UPI0016889348|nr:gamma-glutamyltransferase [Nostoc sp. FACHB-892]MBD2731598.1 gamma-glutamyltransferase [Nostoc sp. FACHB-892]
MGNHKRLKKCLKYFAVGTALISSLVVADMAVFGSIYHPLTYVYKLLSFIGCNYSPSTNCSQTPLSNSDPNVLDKNGIVVTTQHEASKVGLRILKEGGNAVDAAVAVGYALAVTEPCCGNLGGGGFMLIHLANGKDTFINFREKAPLAATHTMYLDNKGKLKGGVNTKGYLAVAVPGSVKGLEYALSQYGTMTRKQVMAPAIQLAIKGFELQQGDIQMLKTGTAKFKTQPNVANIFLKNGKYSYQVGDRLVQKDLAETLNLISTQGSDAFYKGTIAQEIVKASREQGGILKLEDFNTYAIAEIAPLRCNYRGHEVISAPLPAGGTTLCQMLNILEGYNLKKLGWHSSQSLHYMLSAMLYAYADRNKYLGDPQFVNNPVEKLLSKNYATSIRSQIPYKQAIPPEPLYSEITSYEGTQTTHYSIQDRHGNAVAVTYTINSNFGAGVIAGNTGFLLNNEMDGFTSKPGVANNYGLVQGKANIIAPGKRPLSSMAPTIVKKHGKVFLITGSPGGPTIPTTVLQIITNVIDYDKNITEAVNAPRIHYQGIPNVVITEPYTLKSNVIQDLWSMGYRVIPFSRWGAAESIMVNPKTGLLYGVNDSRKPAGQAVGY